MAKVKLTSIRLGRYLKERRLESGLSQMEVSVKLGYPTAQFVSSWERGVSAPPVARLKSIARFYQIDATDIFEILLSETLAEVSRELNDVFETSK